MMAKNTGENTVGRFSCVFPCAERGPIRGRHGLAALLTNPKMGRGTTKSMVL